MTRNELKELIRETMMTESLKSQIKKLVNESIEEIKHEKKDSLAEEINELDKAVKDHNKDLCVNKDNMGNFNVEGDPNHNFSIRPKSDGIYDVVYIKDDSQRQKKFNLKLKELKEYIKEKLTDKALSYTQTAYNKCAENNKDQVTKSELPSNYKFVKKEIKDTKNDNKDYNEPAVTKKEDMPDSPFSNVDKFKKQSEHPVKGTKPDYTQPKLSKKESKLTIKPKSKGKFKKLS